MSATLGGNEVHFASLGNKLRLAREARGLTIEQIAKATRIRPNLLRNLEGDDFTHFSHPSYLRLYLIDYAKFLDLPVSEIQDWLPAAGRPGSENYEYIAGLGGEESGKPKQEYFYPRGNSHRIGPRLMRGALVVAVICMVAYLVILINNLQRIGSSGQVPSPTAAVEAAPATPSEAMVEKVPLVSPVIESTQVPVEVVGVSATAFQSVVPAPETPPPAQEAQQANLSLTSPDNSTPAGSQIQ